MNSPNAKKRCRRGLFASFLGLFASDLFLRLAVRRMLASKDNSLLDDFSQFCRFRFLNQFLLMKKYDPLLHFHLLDVAAVAFSDRLLTKHYPFLHFYLFSAVALSTEHCYLVSAVALS